MQLASRKSFAYEKWRDYFSEEEVQKIIEILKDATDTVRSNYHYIPDDKLEFLFLYTKVDDILLDMSFLTKEFWQKDLVWHDIEEMLKKEFTLKDFFKEIIKS